MLQFQQTQQKKEQTVLAAAMAPEQASEQGEKLQVQVPVLLPLATALENQMHC